SPQAQAKMADDEAKPKGRKKKGKASRNEEKEKTGLAKAGPQGGPLLPLSAEPAAQANTDPEPGASNASLEFRPLRSSLAEFAPPPKPQAPEPEAVRRVLEGGDAASPSPAGDPVVLSGKSDALPRSVHAFAQDSAIARAPSL